MSGRYGSNQNEIPASLKLDEGLHCSHFYYRWDRAALADLDFALGDAVEEFVELFGPTNVAADSADAENYPLRSQIGLVAGDKADFSLMIMDSDPLKVERVNQRILASQLGLCLEPTYSFVSMSEISEYVPTVEEFAAKLKREGIDPESEQGQMRVKGYADRLPAMNKHRLAPEFPDWPVSCFYPMNKRRDPGANWFDLPFSARNEMMSEHARSGIQFMGKVTQLITVGVGVEDWEWGVTLWAKNPQYLKEIVYKMRFDKASALFAEFGPFYTSYIMDARQMLEHCQINNQSV